MTPEVAEIVGRRTQPKELMDLTQKCKDLVRLSRSEMSKNYDRWDFYDQVYRGERKADESDKKAQQRGEPVKQILPLTFGQIQTFVSFGYSLFNQRDYYFDTIASGVEDEAASKMASAILEQNLTYNKYRNVKLVQKLTDIARWGVGVTKTSWVRETQPVVEEVVDQDAMQEVRSDLAAPVEQPTKTQVTYKTKYLGNKIVNVSPYRWFPDTRLPLSRWSEGEFCADEIEISKIELHKQEKQGLVAGSEFVTDLTDESFKDRRMAFLKRGTGQTADPIGGPYSVQYRLLTEVQIRLNPAETLIDKDTPLGPADCEQIYIVWILNDDRIVRISEAGYDHEEFGYDCAQLFEDQNHFVNFSLADVLSALQDTATWFLNSRVTNVRKTVFNQFIVDTGAIEIDDIVKRRPVIRMKSGRAGSGVNNWIQQLNVQDVTQNHVNDIGVLSSMAKEATGINETLLGQFSSGRRSAKEAANVANYAAARLVMILGSVWESSDAPMARKMLSNNRQGLDEPTLVKVYGQVNTQMNQAAAVQLVPGLAAPQLAAQGVPMYQLQSITKDQLIGNYDLSIFNGTLPSQRQAIAAVLMEWLQTAMKDPRTVLVTGLDPKLVLFEVFELLGVRNVQRFGLTPERLQQLMSMAQPAPNPGGSGSPPRGGR